MGLLLPALIAVWQSLEAAVASGGHCHDERTGEAFRYVLDGAAASGGHIPVGETADGGRCRAASVPTAPETPKGEALAVHPDGLLGPGPYLYWNEASGAGLMGRLVQVAMGLSVLLAVGSTLILCLQGEREETADAEGQP